MPREVYDITRHSHLGPTQAAAPMPLMRQGATRENIGWVKLFDSSREGVLLRVLSTQLAISMGKANSDGLIRAGWDELQGEERCRWHLLCSTEQLEDIEEERTWRTY